jgi:hypothetical protein
MRSDTTPAGARDLGDIWKATWERIGSVLRDAPESVVDTPAPTVPGTTVGDVLTHLVETATAAADDSRTIAQAVLSRPAAQSNRATVLADLLADWDKAAALVHDRIDADPQFASAIITVAVMCEHDLRDAVGSPGARDDIAIKVALDELSGRFSDRVEAADLPPLRVTVEQWGTIIGAGRATSCVVADRFEFVRAMSGRRSAAEIVRWNWGVSPDAYLPVMSEVDLPTDEIHERDPRIPKHMRDREFVL